MSTSPVTEWLKTLLKTWNQFKKVILQFWVRNRLLMINNHFTCKGGNFYSYRQIYSHPLVRQISNIVAENCGKYTKQPTYYVLFDCTYSARLSIEFDTFSKQALIWAIPGNVMVDIHTKFNLTNELLYRVKCKPVTHRNVGAKSLQIFLWVRKYFHDTSLLWNSDYKLPKYQPRPPLV